MKCILPIVAITLIALFGFGQNAFAQPSGDWDPSTPEVDVVAIPNDNPDLATYNCPGGFTWDSVELKLYGYAFVYNWSADTSYTNIQVLLTKFDPAPYGPTGPKPSELFSYVNTDIADSACGSNTLTPANDDLDSNGFFDCQIEDDPDNLLKDPGWQMTHQGSALAPGEFTDCKYMEWVLTSETNFWFWYHDTGAPYVVPTGATIVSSVTDPVTDATTVTLLGDSGGNYVVTTPLGTGPIAPNTALVYNISDIATRPGIQVIADLPAGKTKTVTLPRPGGSRGRKLCVKDNPGSDEAFLEAGATCEELPGEGTIALEPAGGSGGFDFTLNDSITRHVEFTATETTVSGLVNTMIQYIGDDDLDGVSDDEDMCLGTDLAGPVPSVSLRPNHTGDDQTIYGCNASQILDCKPGNNNGEKKFGITRGTREVFTEMTDWAVDADSNGRPDCLQ